MITTSYYKLKGDTLIRRDQSEIRVNFRLMNKDTNGQWTDGHSIGEVTLSLATLARMRSAKPTQD